jgi:LysR family nitrogen assimilation transcriptional regulator
MGAPPSSHRAAGRPATRSGKSQSRRSRIIAGTEPLLDAHRLYYFFHVARLGSFTRAEAFLKVAQPALSRQVQLLEAELGAVLLLRLRRGVQLTDLGKIVFSHAAQILDAMKETRQRVEMARSHLAAEVAIGLPVSFAATFLPTILADFREKFPAVKLRVMEAPTGQLQEWLVTNVVDMAVLVNPVEDARLILEALFVDQAYLVAAPNRPHMERPHVSFSEIRQLPLVLLPSGRGSRGVIDDFARRHSITIVPQLELENLQLIKRLLQTSECYSIFPYMAVAEELKGGVLKCVPFKPRLTRNVYLAAPGDRPTTNASRALLSELKQIVRAAPQQLGHVDLSAGR